tara:strand:- start:181 stop:516 length:336 start_codon:yes stop_codon:yes gene_type:complete
MLIELTTQGHSPLVCPEHRRQKPGLTQQTPRTPVKFGVWFKFCHQQTLKSIHGPMAASQLVVERKELADQTWSEPKGRFDPGGNSVVCRGPTTHQPLHSLQQRRRVVRSPV